MNYDKLVSVIQVLYGNLCDLLAQVEDRDEVQRKNHNYG